MCEIGAAEVCSTMHGAEGKRGVCTKADGSSSGKTMWSGLSDAFCFVCGGWLVCKRQGGWLNPEVRGCRGACYYARCRRKEASVCSGLKLAVDG